MKIKKSVLNDIIREEIEQLVKEQSTGWDKFKRGLMRGFTQGGKRKSFIAQMVAGAGLPAEAKAAMAALGELEEALANMTDRPDVGAIRGGTGEDAAKSAVAAAADTMGSTISVSGMKSIAAAMRQDLQSLFAQLGPDAPEAKEGSGKAPEKPPEMSDDEYKERMKSAGLHTENLRRSIRKKLRQQGFIS